MEKSKNKENNKYIWGAVAVLAIIIIAILVVRADKKTAEDTTDTPLATETAPVGDTTLETAPPKPRNTKPPVVTPTAPKLSYTDAVALYGNGYRVQFGENCNASPAQVSYRGGSQVMLDNRSNSAKNFLFNSRTIVIEAYDYTVISLPIVTEAQPYYIDCGASQNVATFLVQP